MERELTDLPAPPSLQLLYTSTIEIATPLVLGDGPYGQRRIINITGGTFAGPRLSGRILPGGADWQILRTDDSAEVEARYTLETDDGALIYITNWGYRHGPKEVMERLARGEEVSPQEYYFRTTPRFETGAKEYACLNGLVCVSVGERRPDQVVLTVFEVR